MPSTVHLVCFAVISGLAALIIADPVVRFVLLLASPAYIGYLALKIALAGTKIGFIHIAAPGFISGMMLQLINRKAYAVNTMLLSSFAFYPQNFFIETGLKLLINNALWIPIQLIWLYARVKVSQLDLPVQAHKIIKLAMTGCLLAWSVYPWCRSIDQRGWYLSCFRPINACQLIYSCDTQ